MAQAKYTIDVINAKTNTQMQKAFERIDGRRVDLTGEMLVRAVYASKSPSGRILRRAFTDTQKAINKSKATEKSIEKTKKIGREACGEESKRNEIPTISR